MMGSHILEIMWSEFPQDGFENFGVIIISLKRDLTYIVFAFLFIFGTLKLPILKICDFV